MPDSLNSYITLLRKAFADAHSRVFGSQSVVCGTDFDIFGSYNVSGEEEYVFVAYHQKPDRLTNNEPIAAVTRLDPPLLVKIRSETIPIASRYDIYPIKGWIMHQKAMERVRCSGVLAEVKIMFIVAESYGTVWHEIRHQLQQSPGLLSQHKWKKSLEFVSREPIPGIFNIQILIMLYEDAIRKEIENYRTVYQGRQQFLQQLEGEVDAMCIEAAGILEWVRMSNAGISHDDKMDRIAELLRS